MKPPKKHLYEIKGSMHAMAHSHQRNVTEIGDNRMSQPPELPHPPDQTLPGPWRTDTSP